MYTQCSLQLVFIYKSDFHTDYSSTSHSHLLLHTAALLLMFSTVDFSQCFLAFFLLELLWSFEWLFYKQKLEDGKQVKNDNNREHEKNNDNVFALVEGKEKQMKKKLFMQCARMF